MYRMAFTAFKVCMFERHGILSAVCAFSGRRFTDLFSRPH
jgi:hypothetical protein